MLSVLVPQIETVCCGIPAVTQPQPTFTAEPGGVCSLSHECFAPPTLASLPLATAPFSAGLHGEVQDPQGGDLIAATSWMSATTVITDKFLGQLKAEVLHTLAW
jgi:hypothetical protein